MKKTVAYIQSDEYGCFGNVASAKYEGCKVITLREFSKLCKKK